MKKIFKIKKGEYKIIIGIIIAVFLLVFIIGIYAIKDKYQSQEEIRFFNVTYLKDGNGTIYDYYLTEITSIDFFDHTCKLWYVLENSTGRGYSCTSSYVVNMSFED
mgnify:CR=1 FL=1